MSATADTAAALYLASAEPSMTAISSRPAQQRVRPVQRQGWNSGGATFKLTSNPQSNGASAQENISLIQTQLTKADLAVAQLFRMEELDTDWDGSGAAKPLLFSLKDARSFIRALAPESIIPKATLHADGHVILFLNGGDTYAELEFLGNNKIDFYARRGGQEWSDEIDFDGRTLPDGLSNIGFAT